MRLWSLHPRYLDRRGLVALWREGLLAQAVLRGRTRGYTRHPQLERFKNQPGPVRRMVNYLQVVQEEATRRGYEFDRSRLARGGPVKPIAVTAGQLEFEWQHLAAKLERRDRKWLEGLEVAGLPCPHPGFRVVSGGIAGWERGA